MKRSTSNSLLMKGIFFLLVLTLFTAQTAFAQILIASNLRQDGKFNKATGRYDPTSKDKTEVSYFEFDREFTACTHLTPSRSSVYTLTAIKEDRLNGRWEFDAVSNAGYRYYLIVDITNNNLRFIYKDKGITHLAQFAVDKYWIDQ